MYLWIMLVVSNDETRCSGPPAINRYGVYLPKGRFSKRGGLLQSARIRPPLFERQQEFDIKTACLGFLVPLEKSHEKFERTELVVDSLT